MVKGGVEVVLGDCTHYQNGSASLPLSQQMKAVVLAQATDKARLGLRGIFALQLLLVICHYYLQLR